jgi:hypothetical protein
MEELIRNFETVINRLIMPRFPSLMDIDIMAGKVTDETRDYIPVFRVQVDYTTKDYLKPKEQREIEQETRSLFKMMGFPETANLRVFFTKIEG